MTIFHLFVTCFFVGALPGLVMVIRNMARSYRLTRRVEQLARQEGQWLDYSSLETKRKILRDPDSLITEKDSEVLAHAKRQASIEGKRIVKHHFIWGGAMIFGAILGAGVGYWLARSLGLPDA